MSNTIDLQLVREGDAHLKRAKRLNSNVTARPVPVEAIINGALTVTQLAQLAGVHPQTIRRAIAAGELSAASKGYKGHNRISRAEAQAWWARRGGGTLLGDVASEQSANGTSGHAEAQGDTQTQAEAQADEIWAAMVSGDDARRDSALRTLFRAPDAVQAIVMQRSGEAAAAFYATPEGEAELADWRALDGEPFHDDAGDYYSAEEEAAFRAQQQTTTEAVTR